MARLWDNRDLLLEKLDQLPMCLCHHDAFRRNLMLRHSEQNTMETVAIDWALIGPGRLGEEIGTALAMNLIFREVSSTDISKLDKALFEGYCEGLQDAGWKGNQDIVRFGYTAIAALTTGLSIHFKLMQVISENGVGVIESVLGISPDDAIEQWSGMQSFFLDLGDEALQLMESI